MITAAILFICVLAFLLFLVAYCRSLTNSAGFHAPSREAQDAAGIRKSPTAADFVRVKQLLRLLPIQSETDRSLRIVGFYYWILSFLESTVTRLSPSFGSWAEEERTSCARFALLVLDRQIALESKAQSH
jgi:hypothetical protein